MKTGLVLAGLGLITVAACGGSSGGSDDADAAPPRVDGVGLADGPLADAPRVDAVPVDAGPTTTSAWTAAAGLPETACVPWVLHDTAEPEGPTIAGGVMTLGDDSDGEAMYYAHPPEALAFPTNLVIEATMRFVSGTSQQTGRTGAAVGFTLDDDRKNLLFIGDGVVFMLSAENTRGAQATVATTDAPHAYRIEADTVTGDIEVFQDDVSLFTTTTFLSPYDVENGINFGEASLIAHATSEWTSVTHNALSPVACP